MATETPHTKFPLSIKNPPSDYGSDIDIDDAALTVPPPAISLAAAGSDYGSDFDSDSAEIIFSQLAALEGSAQQATEPIEEAEDYDERKYFARAPIVSRSAGSRSSLYSACEGLGGEDLVAAAVAVENTVASHSHRMCMS